MAGMIYYQCKALREKINWISVILIFICILFIGLGMLASKARNSIAGHWVCDLPQTEWGPMRASLTLNRDGNADMKVWHLDRNMSKKGELDEATGSYVTHGNKIKFFNILSGAELNWSIRKGELILSEEDGAEVFRFQRQNWIPRR